MKQGHVLYYPEGAATSADKFHGVAIEAPDFAAFGVHFGFPGQRVAQTSELDAAVRQAMASVQSGTTAILNVLVSR
jgi:acetolactate synthase-1/2/3 large subunit